MSVVNKGFKVCASYPQEVIVPVAVTDDVIKKVSVLLAEEGSSIDTIDASFARQVL